MTLHLYDSATRAKTEFRPLHEGRVSIYACGPTVQSSPHLGHIRKEVNFDVLRRWLEASGYEVTFVANITDIDDKILAKAAEAGRPWWAHAALYEGEFHEAYRALGIRPPTYEPRATGHIPEMVELIATLIERGHAYVAGPGDVYFDVASWPAYGELSGMKVDELDAGEEQSAGKRDPRDFALWKANKPDEPHHRVLADPVGAGAAPAGTWSARRWPASTWATPSTSTAAGSTCASPTTRTSWRRAGPRGVRSRASGCTTPG